MRVAMSEWPALRSRPHEDGRFRNLPRNRGVTIALPLLRCTHNQKLLLAVRLR
jgi:hypothetical protein